MLKLVIDAISVGKLSHSLIENGKKENNCCLLFASTENVIVVSYYVESSYNRFKIVGWSRDCGFKYLVS